ncbi:CapA family protein [Halobacillus sp. B23F22_1]|uniref:CapA family protein n=1 Tax=Halobacillus sp. B23F22_1 TaxID=3459514 RepID=UPI00373F5BD3
MVRAVFILSFILAGCSGVVEDSKAAKKETFSAHSNKTLSEWNWKDSTALKGTNTDMHEPIELVATGDVMFEWSLEQTIEEKGPQYPFEQVSEQITSADYAITNLETAVTDKGVKEEKVYNFRTDPENLEGLVRAGFDFVSLANNHTLDYGREGLLDTLSYLHTYNLDYAGAGHNEKEAYQFHTIELNGKTVSLLAFSQVLPSTDWYARGEQTGIASGYQQERCIELIDKANEMSDYTIVYMHWGKEGEAIPEQETRDYATRMVHAGADAVIGSHPHVLQGFETIEGTPVAYSLGNFLFPDYVEGPQAQTGLLYLELHNGEVQMKFEPWKIKDDQIINPGEQYKDDIWTYLEDISFGVAIEDGAIRAY